MGILVLVMVAVEMQGIFGFVEDSRHGDIGMETGDDQVDNRGN